jgi:stage II sporulation protein M
LSLQDDVLYLKSIRIYIGLSVLLFAATGAIGYFIAGADSELAATMIEDLEMLKWIMEQPTIIIMAIIFLKNLLASAMAVLLGLGLGIVPMLVVVTNGLLLGIVAYNVIQSEGALYLLAGILPHGIIELPVVLISIAIGFRLGHVVALSLARETADLRGETEKAIGFLIWWAAPLLLLAAFIEAFITPLAISVVA